MTRRALLAAAASSVVARSLPGDAPVADPWSKDELMEPAALAQLLRTPQKPPVILAVAFPALYRQRHIAHAELAGPTSKPEGIAALKQAVAGLPQNAAVVIYCGCCPMGQCPNIRPAYRMLKDLGYTNLRVLNLPTNLHTDWTEKGFPVEP
ncbi:MAG: rhodanese-like domain-containing protein [Acidobacteriaceae bacterium]|nr:rhodanese-like domain-containing protein [Acidobacteriaceae bacterium]